MKVNRIQILTLAMLAAGAVCCSGSTETPAPAPPVPDAESDV